MNNSKRCSIDGLTIPAGVCRDWKRKLDGTAEHLGIDILALVVLQDDRMDVLLSNETDPRSDAIGIFEEPSVERLCLSVIRRKRTIVAHAKAVWRFRQAGTGMDVGVAFVGFPLRTAGTKRVVCLYGCSRTPKRYSSSDIFFLKTIKHYFEKDIALLRERETKGEERKNSKHLKDTVKGILNRIPYMIYMKDSFGNIVYANKALAKAYNLKLNDVVQKNQVAFHPKYREVLGFLMDDMNVLESGLNMSWDRLRFTVSKGNARVMQTDKIPVKLAGEHMVLVISKDITDAVRKTRKLRKKARLYEGVVEDQSELILRFRPDGIITFVNKAFLVFFDMQDEQLCGTAVETLFDRKNTAIIGESLKELSAERPFCVKEWRTCGKNEETLWIEWVVRAIFAMNGSVSEYQVVGRDITRRKLAEEELKKSLTEKELLLREVHHRVKNNLSVITSLIHLQVGSMETEHDCRIFGDFENRVVSIAMIHDKLYKKDDLARIHMSEYLRDLCSHIMSSYATRSSRITVSLDIHNEYLSIDIAIPVGLIVNELVTNSLKYAFPDARAGVISISLHAVETDAYLFRYSDDGIGLDAHIAEIEGKSTGLGLQLVRCLVEQLRGTMETNTKDGTQFTVRFPVSDTI